MAVVYSRDLRELVTEEDDFLAADTPIYILCPFHNDSSRPSMRVYPDGAHCFTCGKHLHRAEFCALFDAKEVCNAELVANLLGRRVAPSKPPAVNPVLAAVSAHKTLFNGSAESQRVIDYLNTRGLDDDTLQQYQLGFNGVGISLPVWDAENHIETVRYRRWDGVDEHAAQPPHKYWGLRGINGVRLYPWPAISDERIVLTEGEFDALLLRQFGLPAYSLTNGNMAGVKRVEEFERFFPRVRRFLLVRDQDEAGKGGTIHLRKELELLNVRWRKDSGASVDVVEWPVEYGKDVTELYQQDRYLFRHVVSIIKERL